MDINLLKYCSTTNTPKFNQDKLVEELAEFLEVIIKLKTKAPNNPKRIDTSELVKEFGDVIYRGMIYLMQEFPEKSFDSISEEIAEHIEHKLNMLNEWKEKGTYVNGL